MVDQVFQDNNAAGGRARACGGEQLAKGGEDGALHCRQGTAVQVEACHLLQDVLVGNEHGDIGTVWSARRLRDERFERGQPAPGHEEGTRVVPRADGAFDDVR